MSVACGRTTCSCIACFALVEESAHWWGDAERLLRNSVDQEISSATFVPATSSSYVDVVRFGLFRCGSAVRQLRSTVYGTRPPSRLSVRHDVSPEGAGDSSTTVAVADELTDVHAGDKRERSPEVAVGDGSAATASGDRHLADDPHEGAVPPLRPCRALTASSYLHSQPVIR